MQQSLSVSRSAFDEGAGTEDRAIKWAQWEQELMSSHSCPKDSDITAGLPLPIKDPVDGGDMIKENGIWKNLNSGAVFLCRNVLFELVEENLEPIVSPIQDPIRKSPVSGKPMVKYRSARIPELVIDKCTESRGFYFDAGELTKLKSFELQNMIKDHEEYQEYRQGFTVSRSKHRWGGTGRPFSPGVDSAGVYIKFRTAVFFNKPLGAGLRVSSLTWLKWLLGLPIFNRGNLGSLDPKFNGLFDIQAQNEQLAKALLSEEVREEILEIGKTSLYGDLGEIEITDDYISYTEGPYAYHSRALSPVGKESRASHFDKTEEVLAKLVNLAKMIEARSS